MAEPEPTSPAPEQAGPSPESGAAAEPLSSTGPAPEPVVTPDRPSMRPAGPPPTPRRPERPFGERVRNVSLASAIGVGLLIVAAGVDLRVALRAERAPITPEAMGRAREAIVAKRRPGNLVVHSPLLSVRELAPLGDLQARPDLPALELRRTRRVLALDLAEAPIFGFGPERERDELGEGLILRVFEPAGGQPITLYDLVADVSRTEMRVERPRGTVTSRCTQPRTEGGRSCPGEPDWLYLAPRQLQIDGKNTSCIWAHPTTGGDLVHEVPGLPEPSEGHRLVLELESGMTDDAVRQTPDGASVRVDVEQGGKIRGALTLVNRIGWARTEIPLDPNLPVELRISTPRDGRRHHCIAGRILEREVKR